LLEGVGIGFFTRTQVADALTVGRAVEVPIVDLPPIARDSALVHVSRERAPSAVAAAFAGCVREQAARLGLLDPG